MSGQIWIYWLLSSNGQLVNLLQLKDAIWLPTRRRQRADRKRCKGLQQLRLQFGKKSEFVFFY